MKKTKLCIRCKKRRPLVQFYAHPGMADGRLGKCKDCTKADTTANRNAKLDYYRDYDKDRSNLPHRVKLRQEYSATEEGRAAGNRAKKRWEARNPEKKKAATTLNNAIRDGKIERGIECVVCGSRKNIEAHHEDYSKPLEVIWLCKRDHWKADQRRRQRYTFQILESRIIPISSTSNDLRPTC